MPQALAAVNDIVVKFANVNGSGSASANELVARAILRMGVPISPRNLFPSTIQGLPTWYEVRVTEKGYLGRRGGVAGGVDGWSPFLVTESTAPIAVTGATKP